MPVGAPSRGKGLAGGQLPSSKGTLFSAGESFIDITWFSCFNTQAVTGEVVKVYINIGGVSRQFDQNTIAAVTTKNFIPAGQVLSIGPGDYIEGETTTASKVDYYIGGRAT